jgi:hypothetical protein
MAKLLLYIVAKDLSIWMIYFILMKYNLTGQTYTSATVANFPGAPKMDFVSMICASLYISFMPLLFDVVMLGILHRYLLAMIYRSGLKSIRLSAITAVLFGLILHIPVILFWTAISTSQLFSPNITFNISALLSLIVAGSAMVIISRCTTPTCLKSLMS